MIILHLYSSSTLVSSGRSSLALRQDTIDHRWSDLDKGWQIFTLLRALRTIRCMRAEKGQGQVMIQKLLGVPCHKNFTRYLGSHALQCPSSKCKNIMKNMCSLQKQKILWKSNPNIYQRKSNLTANQGAYVGRIQLIVSALHQSNNSIVIIFLVSQRSSNGVTYMIYLSHPFTCTLT